MGWPNVTPDTVRETVPMEWIVFARIKYEAPQERIVNDARSIFKEREERREKDGRKKPKQAGHLKDASFDAPGQPGREPPEGGSPRPH